MIENTEDNLNNTEDISPNVDVTDTSEEETTDDLAELYKLAVPEQSIESIGEAMRFEKDLIGDSEFVTQMSKTGTYVELLKRMVDVHTDQTLFITETLKRLVNIDSVGDSYEYKADVEIDDDKSFSLKNSVLRLDKSLNGIEVSGQQSRMLILSANRNVKKIYLYNSGFNIVLRGPSLGEMNLVFNRINDELGEYGKLLGSIFFMYADFKIKDILWEFIQSLVISSNLNKWDKGNRLRDCISLNDYQPILLGISTLMYKHGYDFVHVCTDTACKHTSTELVDLNLLQLTDFSRISHKQLAALSLGKPVDPEAVRKYRAALGFDNSIDIGKYRIHRRVPTMTRYMTDGSSFNDNLAMSIHDITDPKIVDQYLKYNYCRLFESWVSYVEVLDLPSNEVSFKTADKESINLVLTEIQNSDHNDEFVDKMNAFIQETSITNVGYLAPACPACGKAPTGLVNGFAPFDAQNSFFTMLVMRLIQTS